MAILFPKKTPGPDELSFISGSERDSATEVGYGNAERSHRDFAINGRSLRQRIGVSGVSVFGWLDRRTERGYTRLLLPPKPSPRVPRSGATRAILYICGQCADLGCGYFSVLVSHVDNCVVWSDPMMEDGALRPESPNMPSSYPHTWSDTHAWRDFWFDEVAYRTALALFL